MKYLVTLQKIESLSRLARYADGFIIGNKRYAHSLMTSFTVDQINQIIQESHLLAKEVFILLNQMFTELQIEELRSFILSLNVYDVKGFIISDIGLLPLFKELNLINLVVYNPETLLTNYFDFNYLKDQNIMGCFVSKEITLNDITTISNQKAYQLFYFGHGHLPMFYSRRLILDAYTQYLQKENYYHDNYQLYLTEEQRQDEDLRILEDDAGFHVYRGKVLTSISALKTLKRKVNYFIIDSLFKDDKYTLDALRLYHKRITLEQFLTLYQESLCDGFLYQKTIYKGKIDD